VASSNFPACLAVTLAYEGGYVDNPKDPGGATNRGVTLGTLSTWLGRKATKAEVKALTVADVTPIYRRNYWQAVSGDQLPRGVDLATFDYGVNSGVSRAAKALQKVVGVKQDGAIGVSTLASVSTWPSGNLVVQICDSRLAFLRGLTSWKTFGKGWGTRVGAVKAKALLMAGQTTAKLNEIAAADEQAATADKKQGGKVVSGGGAIGAAGTGASATGSLDWTAIAALGVAAIIIIICGIVLIRRARARREVAAAVRAVAANPTGA